MMHSHKVFIEAESFTNQGGWVVDGQHIDQMGSAYLMAHGLGTPVKDATTTLSITTEGRYHCWARTRDWGAQWALPESPGRFQVAIDGDYFTNTLGTEGNAWHWQYAGSLELTSGQHVIALHDLTGFNGRCDAIYLSPDCNDAPPDDSDALSHFRESFLSPSLKASEENEVEADLVVVGGGVAGLCAAITAARLGLQVALIHNRPVLGGNSSSEVRVLFDSDKNLPPYVNLGNLVHELEGNCRGLSNDEHKLRLVEEEPNIQLYLHYHCQQVTRDGSRITSVTSRHCETNQEIRFKAPLFADCSGDANLGYLAGAEMRSGRESFAQTSEPLAPQMADQLILGSTLHWTSKKGDETSFPDFDWNLPFNETSCQHAVKGGWNWEIGFDRDQVNDAENIRDSKLRAIFANWNFQKNHSQRKEEYAHRTLVHVNYVLGKRESRRIMGDYIYSQHDIIKEQPLSDNCVTSKWGIDLHYADPKNSEQFPYPFRAIAKCENKDKHEPRSMPYRCFYSRTIDNLLMAGRNVSYTHIALAMFRCQRTTGIMGEVIGRAAKLCIEHDARPRDIYENYLDALIDLFKTSVDKRELPMLGHSNNDTQHPPSDIPVSV